LTDALCLPPFRSFVLVHMTTSLVITAIGPDRPGIVNELSQVAQRFGANWEQSRMASLAGQFAGMAHFVVDDSKSDALAAAFRALEGSGLTIVIARGAPTTAPSRARRLRLDLVGHDRPGIVRELSGGLARLGVSIDELHTLVTGAAMSGEPLFRVKALLAVPEAVTTSALRTSLESLADEMMVDLEPAQSLGA
jgi:methionyl-tRNA formyltransferase